MSKDTIYRQAAIDAVKCGALSAAMVYGRTDEESTALRETVKAIKALPSAQPETDEWCTDCKEYDHEKHCCPRFNRVIRQTLSEQPEIIFCKDCKHKSVYRFPPKYDKRDYCEKHGKVVDVADFCSWAERREE